MSEIVTLSTVQEIRGNGIVLSALNQLAVREALSHVARVTFLAEDVTLERLCVLGEVVFADRQPDSSAVLLRPDPDMLVALIASRGQGEVVVAGRDRDAVDRVARDVSQTLGDPEPEDEVAITFWAQRYGSPSLARRRIASPSWPEIRENYSDATGAGLDPLMEASEPGAGGLVLWHGAPGSGKSYALRALVRAWRGWCDTHVITDADAFLGEHANYVLEALLRSERVVDGERRWRLIVLEDAGELLAADARAVAGQALSRLLNLTDGLLGAGMRTLVLVTTNEPLRRMHPAVVRPGRTWAEVEFSPLSVEEANGWLAARRVEARIEREATLAELYALAAGRALAAPAPLGFAA